MAKFNPVTERLSEAGYYIDIKFVIDATGGMKPFWISMRNRILDFYKQLTEAMADKAKVVEQIRVQVIPFRDFAYTDFPALEISPFFKLPEDSSAFEDYVRNITPIGGGDFPESALEAIVTAMKGEWTSEGDRRRHIIAVFTDDEAVPLGDIRRVSAENYPDGMPRDLNELGMMWHSEEPGTGMPDPRAARMLIFAPNVTPWDQLDGWEKTWVVFVEKGQGLRNIHLDSVAELFRI